MSQPARYLHRLTPLAAGQVTAWDVDDVGDDAARSLMHHFVARAGLIGALTALIVSSGAWMGVTVRAIAWTFRF